MEKNQVPAKQMQNGFDSQQNQGSNHLNGQHKQEKQQKALTAQKGEIQGHKNCNFGQYKHIQIEQILKFQYKKYLKHKSLLEDLLYIEQEKVLQSYHYLWEKGGKKLRMIMALMISDLFTLQLKPQVVRIGGLIELLHCASLIIDDIEDGSVKRRGQRCAHLVFGVDSAINSANLMYFMPAHRLFTGLTDPVVKWALAEVFLQEMTFCHIGQGLDVRVHSACSEKQLPSRKEYFRLTSLKTGGLLRMMVKMLSIVIGVDKDAEKTLLDCVNAVGIAFQIADDLLNLARSDKMGKGVVAEDLHERKFTLIVDEMRFNEQFMGLFFKKSKENEDIERMLHLIQISGTLERCQSVAQALALQAVSLVDRLQCPYPLEPFKLFIRYIVDRKA